MTSSLLLAMALGALPSESAPGIFSEKERLAVMQYWNKPGRLVQTEVNPGKPYVAAYSPQASAWLMQMYRLRDPGVRLRPDVDPKASTTRHAAWDTWINEQYSRDFAWATAAAAWINEDMARDESEAPRERALVNVPPDLESLAGAPPSFFIVVRPQRHTVMLEGFSTTYEDGVDVRRKWPFYRSAYGVVASGSSPNSAELASGLRAAKVAPRLASSLSAVSQMEGGFDAVNTYDTGGVSVGLVQFAALMHGKGPLADLLALYRGMNRAGFQSDFRRYGVDVAPDGRLTVIDPRTGFEVAGGDAVRAIVRDKRLTAVFQRAGQLSASFRGAQLRLVAQNFDPSTRMIPIQFGAQVQEVRVGDFVQSESGIATLLDRLVNTGNLDPLPRVVREVMQEFGLTTLAQLRAAEWHVIEKMTYRHDFLASGKLKNPDPGLLASAMGQPGQAQISGNVGGARPNNMEWENGQTPPADPGMFGLDLPNGKPAQGRLVERPQEASAPAPNQASPGKTASAPPIPETETPKQPGGPITTAGG